MVSLHVAVALFALSNPGQTVLLDFTAPWCGGCKTMDPVVHQLIQQGYPIRQVNVDREGALASRFGIKSIPCFVMLVDGREVDRVVGATSSQRLIQMCQAGATATAKPAVMAAAAPAAQPAIMPTALTAPAQPMAAAPATAAAPAASDSEFISFNARLRIEDSHGWSCGSGTVIDSRQGEALILTCAHIFRESKGQGRIEVDLFGVNAMDRVPGRVVHYDLDRDVGLVSIHVPRPLVVAKMAPANYPIRPGDPVVTVGCNNGGNPDAVRTQITKVNRYSGFPNMSIGYVPQQGRSGGGLFSPEGLVVGVCNAADPPQEGLFASAPGCHEVFERVGVSQMMLAQQGANLNPGPAAVAPPTTIATAPTPATPPIAAPVSAPTPAAGRVIPAVATVSTGAAATLNADEQALLDEIHRRQGDGAEVICIIRPRGNTPGRSEVVVLDKASSALLERLAAETRVENPIRATSFEIPRETPPSARIVSPPTNPAPANAPATGMMR